MAMLVSKGRECSSGMLVGRTRQVVGDLGTLRCLNCAEPHIIGTLNLGSDAVSSTVPRLRTDLNVHPSFKPLSRLEDRV